MVVKWLIVIIILIAVHENPSLQKKGSYPSQLLLTFAYSLYPITKAPSWTDVLYFACSFSSSIEI